jgi:DNA helicase HerA-like ATPase
LPLQIPLSQVHTHWHILGTTGSGKSSFLAHLFLSFLQHGLPVTLIDPAGDLAKLILSHLVAKGWYHDMKAFARLIYLDLPAGERQPRYIPFNPLKYAYDPLKRREQMSFAGSVQRRAALLTDLPILRYSFAQPDNLLQFRQIMDSGRSVMINLALGELEASRLLGCLLTMGYEQAALSRADTSERRSLKLINDEFHNFAIDSSQAFDSMPSQTRKYGLYLGLAHQFWGQANQYLQEALQNTGIEVVFNVGRTDAEYTAKELGRIDPLQVKHEVADEYAVEKTHPVFYSVTEQWQSITQYLQDLPERHFALKLRKHRLIPRNS